MRFLQLWHTDGFLVGPCSEQCSFIQKVGEFRAGITWGPSSDYSEVHTGIKLHILGMYFEDGLASTHIGKIDCDLTVESSWSEQGRIENIGTICCRDDDDTFLCVKSVHFDEQGIECLL